MDSTFLNGNNISYNDTTHHYVKDVVISVKLVIILEFEILITF